MWPDWTNMLSWWQWLILAAVPPAIVLLYFLKLKRRPLEVPSTYLWHKSIEDLHVNSIWQRLRWSILLLLQLLLLLLAAVALGRPHWLSRHLLGARSILLVDNSASMSATDESPTRLDEAKRRAADMIDQMRSGDVAMVISFSDAARVEQSFTDNRRRLREAIDAIQPTRRPTSLLEALKVASGLANPGRSADDTSPDRVAEALPAKLVILSDGKFPPATGFELGNLDPVFVPIGKPAAANVGITNFNIGRHESRPDRLQAFARLEKFGPEPVTAALELFLNGRLIGADRLELPPGEPRGAAFPVDGTEQGLLRLKATVPGDQLACDNEAFAVLNEPQRAKVLLLTPGNELLQMALTTLKAAQIADVRVEGPDFLQGKTYPALAAGGAFDLVICDRCRPTAEQGMPRANTLFIGQTPPQAGWAARPKADVPQIIDVEVSHPLLQWVDMSSVILLEGTPLRVPPGGRTLIDSDAGPMMAIAPREGFEDLVMGFVLIDQQAGAGGAVRKYFGTNWLKSPGFPCFALNLLEYLGGRGQTPEGVAVRPGGTVTLSPPDPKAAVRVHLPDGDLLPLPRAAAGKYGFLNTDKLGFYEAQADGKTFQRFAVNLFDAGESDIRPAKEPAIKIGHVPVAGQKGWETTHREAWKALLLAGLAVLALEWLIFARRVRL